MYSYPRNVKSKCDNSKPYHFWMSAYLSRSLVKEHGISPRDAANATFIAEKAYQINRNVAGDGNQVKNTIFTSALFSPVHQIVRTDLAYAAAGAHYGSRSVDSTSSKEYDVNGAIVNLMKNAGTESVIAGESNGDQIATYFSWNKIFSPNAALSYLK